jgi:hypothetical protein
MAVASGVVHVDQPLVLYRVHASSRSQHGPATDPERWYGAVRRANERVLREIGASPEKARLERDLDAHALWAAAQFHLIAGHRRGALRSVLKAWRLAPRAREPYFVLLRVALGDRLARILRRSVTPACSDDIQQLIEQVNRQATHRPSP